MIAAPLTINAEALARLVARNAALELLGLVADLTGRVEVVEVRGGLRVVVRLESVAGASTAEGGSQTPLPSTLAPTLPTACLCDADVRPSGPPPHLGRIHRKLLEKAPGPNESPMPRKTLATRAGYTHNSYARDAIAYLIRLDYLRSTPEGVRRGNRP